MAITRRRRVATEIRNPETGKVNWREIGYRLRGATAVILAVVVLVGGGGVVAYKGYQWWQDFRQAEDYPNPAGVADVEVVIPKGATLSAMADILVTANVVKTAKAFDRAAAAEPKAKTIQAGKYKMRTQIPAATAVQMLLDSRNILRNRFTIIEGLRLVKAIAGISASTGIPLEQFQAAVAKPADLGLPAWANNSAEGFIYPDTYEIPENPTALALLRLATARFQVVVQDMQLQDKAAALGLTPLQVVTIASLIEAEVNFDTYRAKVARVILNRLAAKMPLQFDTTVNYVTGKERNVYTTDADRATKSPYNTYLNVGLPPGPIDSPGRKSLEAALNPEPGGWMYFTLVDLDTGETRFADTFAEHQANVALLAAWCRAHPGRCTT